MTKKFFMVLLSCLIGIISVSASPMHKISLGEEDESVIYFDDSELFFMLPYEGKMMKMDRNLLAYDTDGFLKLTFNGRQALIIDGSIMKQLFAKFRTDGVNTYDRYTNSEDSTGDGSPFRSYNVKSISATSFLKEKQYGQDVVYAPINLFRAFEIGCRCHPYWWNDAHIPWVEGVSGNGINESVFIEFNNPIWGFSILNGYADVQNMKLYKENSRVKKLKVEDLTNDLEYTMDFEDKVYFNFLDLALPSESLKLTILEVYEGTKYQDTCISAMVENTGVTDSTDKDTQSFEMNKQRCSYSDDIALFAKYFEYVSQPVGNSSIYEKTETIHRATNLFSLNFYRIDDYNRIQVSENSDSRNSVLTFTLDTTNFDSKYADMYIDDYGFKHLKLFDPNNQLMHHFTIIDTHTETVVTSEYPWVFEPNLFRYAFFEHSTELLKDDTTAVARYFEAPSMFVNNGNGINNITVSSYLQEEKTAYLPDAVTQNYAVPGNYQPVRKWSNQTKPWVEGKKGDGIGEIFEFDLSPSAREHWDIRILNGYVDPLKPHLFRENNRIKKALLETDTGIIKEIQFRDEVEFTQVILPRNVTHVKITILEVYTGTKYQDTCITSVEAKEKMNDK